MNQAFHQLIKPSRLTEVVDIGTKPIDGDPSYKRLLADKLCKVTGFEPQENALALLLQKKGPMEQYLPYALGDGGSHTLKICKGHGMSSLLDPNPEALALFEFIAPLAEVIERVPVRTCKLDDVAEIEEVDFVKIDVQGGELTVIQNGISKLSKAVAVQVRVAFVPLHINQPGIGEIDVELRKLGFIPHCFAEIRKWPIGNMHVQSNQLLESDLVYVRDFSKPDLMSDEQLKHLALIAHACCKSPDLAARCLMLLEQRNVIEVGSHQMYLQNPGLDQVEIIAGPTEVFSENQVESISTKVRQAEPLVVQREPLIIPRRKSKVKKGDGSTICLTMIVKNETHILLELFESIYGLIDYWVICDTGSTDGTPEMILEFFNKHQIPGELHHCQWKDFGSNRTEAFDLADGKADYMWVIDADDKIMGEVDFGNLTKDSYDLLYGKDFTYWRKQLFKSGLSWRYLGVLHEYPHSDSAKEVGRFEGKYYIDSRRLGARNQNPKKYEHDALVFEKALKQEPNNARYWFYLGQSYYDAGNYVEAKRAYEKRASLGGWEEEVFYSHFRAGDCAVILKKSEGEILAAFLAAFNSRPARAESLHALAAYYRANGKYELGYLFAKVAARVPFPHKDILFVHSAVYYYKILDELSVCAYYTAHAKEGYEVCKLLLQKQLPEGDRARISNNLELFRKKYGG